ncbi:MAG: DUF1844 domain-containing protein [Myxococcota bacterium]|nr:hypothetical protein [Spirochaeta sp.]RPG12305.1 MAG: DUF1844 domain-containing protein [Proteobacteria bacterium TMED72]
MKSEGEQGEGAPATGAAELPAIDFSTFILSLSTTALYQMGHVADPDTGTTMEPNHTIAQQTIDTLEMIREKTRGNLEPEEAKLLDSLLYELRLQFLKAAN